MLLVGGAYFPWGSEFTANNWRFFSNHYTVTHLFSPSTGISRDGEAHNNLSDHNISYKIACTVIWLVPGKVRLHNIKKKKQKKTLCYQVPLKYLLRVIYMHFQSG